MRPLDRKDRYPWRDLPERFGKSNSVWKRFDRWAAKGVWLRVFEALKDPDMEWLILDSTVIRAHQHAAGAVIKGGPTRRWGARGGGFGTKLHIAVDGLGNPIEFILTGGQGADINQGVTLIEGHDSEAAIADKIYDGDDFVTAIEATEAMAVIPPKKNRIFKRENYNHIYT